MDAPLNPLLTVWDAPFGLPPFESVRPEHFKPAFESGMREHREELRHIGTQSEPPTFDNTMACFDASGRLLSRVEALFHNLAASATSDALQAVQREMAAPLAAHWSAVYMDAALFARIDALHAQCEQLNLSAEQRRLLERVHLDFVRSGARLAGASRARYAQLMQRLAERTTTFAQNVLHDEASYFLRLQGEADLEGLPDFLRAAAQQAASERGVSGHVITLARSLIVPFLTFSRRRDLREQAWRAWISRGEHAGAHDNRPIAREILALRHEQAALHGHASYADYALADTMAREQPRVWALLDDVWSKAVPALERERALLEVARDAQGVRDPIEPWDWRFWAEQVRRQHYALDEAQLKAYFPLPSMVQAAFDCAGRLFGLRFTPRTDITTYHADVRAYEVSEASGRVVGLFLQDNFARAGKRSGAWMSALHWQHRNGFESRPVVLNNNNFARGQADGPTLLSLDDVRTLFHEFGHGLHHLLTGITLPSIGGIDGVEWDAVELPSQFMENFAWNRQALDLFARHVDTGAPLPEELFQRMLAARHFHAGMLLVRQLEFALFDFRLHLEYDPELGARPLAVLEEVRQQVAVLYPPAWQRFPQGFSHIFAGGYAAGYYSYLWAELLSADVFAAFAEHGVIDRATGERFRREFLAVGASRPALESFVAFRGRKPQPEALLASYGLT